MMKLTRSFTTAAALVAVMGTGLSGCQHLTQTERGAVIGATGGAAVGAVIGRQIGSTTRGAIIGAAVGGAAGAIIGRQMDRQAEQLSTAIPGATVQRVGEGIAITFESGLLYPFDSSDLLPAGRENLRNLANSLREHPETEVLIVGHTDMQGRADYNQRLSERRAAAAADVLASHGVPRTRIRTVGRGMTEPITTGTTEADHQLNRRVEVAIFASQEYRDRILRENPGN